jgi:halimadienyl-diphosphate synthase
VSELSDLIADVFRDDFGGLSASVYETARLVALAPWLAGHEARLEFLGARQNADGSWGGPGGWALVPTLSATHALLGIDDSRATQGLAAARALIAEADTTGISGTVVGFLTVPALIGDINAKLDATHRLRLPAGLSDAPLAAMRDGGWRNPLAGHYLEIFGPRVAGSPEVEHVDGNVGCSVAATAAWAGAELPADPAHPAVEFLTRSQARLRGPVPAMTSIEYYERGWIIGCLATSGFDTRTLAPLAAGLPPDAGRAGVPTAPGFAEDAETTAVVLHGLAQLGDVREPEALMKYDAGTHFMSTIPEKWPSTSTNAHIMQAFGGYLRTAPPDAERYADALARVAAWLVERQEVDGGWTDRWHISPVFATTCCVEALHRYAGPQYVPAVRRGLDWLLARQQEDGSWGGTAEETAYALRVLVLTGTVATTAIERGRAFLVESGQTPSYPSLWVGKELYTPAHIVRAAVIGALHLAENVGGQS